METITIQNQVYKLEPLVIEPSVTEEELFADLEYDLAKRIEPDEEELESMFAQYTDTISLEQVEREYRCEMDKEFSRIMKKYQIAILNELYDKKKYILNKAQRVYDAYRNQHYNAIAA